LTPTDFFPYYLPLNFYPAEEAEYRGALPFYHIAVDDGKPEAVIELCNQLFSF